MENPWADWNGGVLQFVDAIGGGAADFCIIFRNPEGAESLLRKADGVDDPIALAEFFGITLQNHARQMKETA